MQTDRFDGSFENNEGNFNVYSSFEPTMEETMNMNANYLKVVHRTLPRQLT